MNTNQPAVYDPLTRALHWLTVAGFIGILTTIDPRRATCCINATADTRKEVVEILTHLDTEVKILADREEAEAGLR